MRVSIFLGLFILLIDYDLTSVLGSKKELLIIGVS